MVSIGFSLMFLMIFALSKVDSKQAHNDANQSHVSKVATAIGAIVFMCVMFYPTLVLMAVDMFNCIQGGVEPTDTFLRVDLRIACDQKHAAAEASVGVWLWIMVVVFVPGVFFLLWRQSHSLESNATLTKFGYLYKGYREDMYLW